MPGKMTVLDRLIKEGRIKKSPFRVKKMSAELRDPLSYPLDMRKDFDKLRDVANVQWVKMTPEREVYQKGIDKLVEAAKKPVHDKWLETGEELSWLQDDFEDAFDEAKKNYIDNLRSDVELLDAPDLRSGFDPSYDLDPNVSSETLESYWPSDGYHSPNYYSTRGGELGDLMDEYEGRLEYMDEPAYRMAVQRQTPRYRNYQRAMQQRAANMAMGRDLSRRYAIAYNNLLRRGLTPAEARMYMREYFGGR